MAKFYAYPDTKQIHDMNRSVKVTTQFTGCDEDGKPQYDSSIPDINRTGGCSVIF